eukprot:5565638-Amphidinium_carterae.1
MIAAEKGDKAKVKALFTEYKAFDNWTEFLTLPPADTTYVGTLQKGASLLKKERKPLNPSNASEGNTIRLHASAARR